MRSCLLKPPGKTSGRTECIWWWVEASKNAKFCCCCLPVLWKVVTFYLELFFGLGPVECLLYKCKFPTEAFFQTSFLVTPNLPHTISLQPWHYTFIAGLCLSTHAVKDIPLQQCKLCLKLPPHIVSLTRPIFVHLRRNFKPSTGKAEIHSRVLMSLPCPFNWADKQRHIPSLLIQHGTICLTALP